MEIQREKKVSEPAVSLESGVPSAPTLDDFYIDPGIEGPASHPNNELTAISPASELAHYGHSEKVLTPAISDPLGATFSTSSDTDIAVANAPMLEEHVVDVTGPLREANSHSEVFKDLLNMSPHFSVQKEIEHMSPHILLQKELSNLSVECEASAPACEERVLETVENHFGESEKQNIISDISIVPFTDSQLHALYHNAELEKNLEFVDHWLETQKNIDKFQLDEMLVNYLRVRTMLGTSKNKYSIDRGHVDNLSKELWVFSNDTIEEEGECEDGNTVIVTRDAKVAEYSDNVSQSLRSRMKQCKETLTEDYSLHCFRSEVLKVKIDEFLHSVLVRQQGGVVERTHLYSPAEEVRLCVSVLFKFLRKDIQDETMVRDLKQWLDSMVAVVLSEATLYDHLFLLNHIMRCPAGVGKWAAAYIQPAIPVTDLEETSFDNPFLDHLITILATILLPVKERRNFVHEFRLKHQWQQEASEEDSERHDTIWTVLDGEGSEDEDPVECWAQLREVDLVALISQIPVDHMFRYVLRIEMRDGCDHYAVSHSTQHSFLKLYAFSTQFVYLIREGLRTFNTPKYRQFAKRLGRLIRHTVHYVSDHWENFKEENRGAIDPSMLLRLQVEYDSFFLRAAKCIFSSQKLGTWQYLADIPFATISPDMLWRIFYVLHLDYRDEHHGDFGVDISDWAKALSSPDLQLQFEEKCSEAGDTEVYFLLSAFANMAISRGIEDRKFIERATLDLFDVGFVCDATRESCSKNCRDLLSGVCHKHPFLLTTILKVMSDRVQHIGKLCGYLLQELPWLAWRPDIEQLKLVYDWLLMPVTSIESHLARIIISSMDWEYGVLHSHLHISTAINIVQAVIKHNPDTGVANTSMAGMATMTNLALVSITSLTSTHTQFVGWAWESLSRLHLHMLDRSAVESIGIMEGNVDIFGQVLDYDLNNQIEVVSAGSVRKIPIACYTSLLLTQLGHSLPELLERGLALLKVVQDAGRMDHVLELLLHIIPLLSTDHSSINNPIFRSIIASLLAADHSYISMAKSIISGTFPGPITRETGNMLEKMIANYSKYGFDSPREIVNLWMNILTSQPDWNVNQSALFLLDIVCCHSFFNPPLHSATLQSAKEIHKKFLLDSSGGIITWITGANYSGHKLVFPASIPQFPWVAYFFLQSEDIHFRESGLWSAIVKQLAEHKNLEEALSSAAASCEVSPPLSSQLPIYRWLQQAMDTQPDHPLVPIFWQRFFQLFMSRPLSNQEGEEPRGVGMSFFVGMLNTMYFNKIKTSLKQLQDFQNTKIKESLRENCANDICDSLAKLYKTFYMWLDEAKILDSTLYIPALSPIYEPEKLAQILSGDRTLWMEYIEMQGPVSDHKKAIEEWDKLHFRVKLENKLRKPYNDNRDISPSDRILKRLQSYEPRMAPLEMKKVVPPIPVVPIDTLLCEEALLHFLQTPIGMLCEMSLQFNTNTSAYGSLNCSYLEMVPLLWKDEEIEVFVKKTCPGTKRGKEKFDCNGAAQIVLNYTEAKKQEVMAVKIEANRKDWECSETRLLAPPAIQFVTAVSVLNSVSHRILRMYEKDLGKGNTFGQSHSLALAVFYQIANCVTEEWLTCPPLRYFVSDSLETLASVVVSGTPGQAMKLLSLLIASPHLSPFLSAHFIPNINNDMEIIEIYKTICELPDGDGALPFVLLSKVDVRNWLTIKPPIEVVSNMIKIIGGALSKTGHDPDPNREMLHGLHRRHLFEILNDNRTHYAEILKLFLSLSEKNQLDPNIWIDLLNFLTSSPGKFSLEYQTREERFSAITEFVLADAHIDLEENADTVAELTKNFQSERLQFGLYGLYPKYRSYVEALTPYFYMLSLQLVFGHLKLNQGALSHRQLDSIWASIESMYGPWLFPLNSSSRASTANWIQQLTNESTLLPPWIPGDSNSATSVMSSFICCVQQMIKLDSSKLVLSKLWTLYATQWAQAGVKDHIFGVIHPAISTLPWATFRPSQFDIDQMVRVMDLFLPPCHSFLGTVFVQIDWKLLIDKKEIDTPGKLYPAMLSLLVKLSGEPNMRQSGKIHSVITEATFWSWEFVEPARFEALAQWLVMSIDCKCVVKHHERNPVDEAILKLFRSAAELKEDSVAASETAVKKQKVWVKCLTKLLTSCGSKHKNFLSYNQPALHTTLRKILEDISTVSLSDSLASPVLVKDFLTILNSNHSSVLPGSTLMVLQSWLNNQSGKSSTLHSFLNQAGIAVTDIKLASAVTESVLEAYFKDSEDDFEPAWSSILDHISWPSGNRIKQLLDQSLSSGHLLLLYGYILFKRPQCISSKEEQVLASTVLDWIRHLSQQPCPGIESKLPLLYRELLILLQRQSAYSSDHAWVVGALMQFCDVLLQIAESSPGWGQNFLGAIGLRSSGDISLKGKFLARALYIFLRILVNMDRTGLVEKELDEESTEKRNLVLSSQEVKPHMEKVQNLKNNKAFSGIHDVIDWVITQTKDETNTLADATLYVDYLVVNRLYTELFLKVG